METEAIPIVGAQDLGNYIEKKVRLFGKVQASNGEIGEIGMTVNSTVITITQENICVPFCDIETLFDITGIVRGENNVELVSCEQCDFDEKIYDALVDVKRTVGYKEIYESN